MAKVKYLVLDILKPHQPSVLEYAKVIAKIDQAYSVNIKVKEVDEKTESAEMIIAGADIDFAKVKRKIEDLGGSLHSIDEVSVGRKKEEIRRQRIVSES